MLKHIIFLGIVAFSFGSCKKNTEQPISQLEAQAKTILQEKMAPADFATLNWEHASVNVFHGKEILVKVPSKNDPEKSLYFLNTTGTPVYNWAKLENKTKKENKISGTLTTMDINNQVLNRVEFVDNKVVSQTNPRLFAGTNGIGLKKKTNSDSDFSDEDLPPVTVVGYINNSTDPIDYTSLLWALNFQYDLWLLYQGNGGQIIDINDMYGPGVYYTTGATKDNLNDTTVQITALNTKAFWFSSLNLKFTYNPVTNTLNINSVSSKPVGGVFLGTWTGPTISNIVCTSTYIEFQYAYINEFTFVGAPLAKEYKMVVRYTLATNEVTWQWQNN